MLRQLLGTYREINFSKFYFGVTVISNNSGLADNYNIRIHTCKIAYTFKKLQNICGNYENH